MGNKRIVIGSRESVLAVTQSRIVLEYLQKKHPELDVSLKTMKTTGDKILDKRLDQIGGKGLFVKELDRALRAGETDLSVHSLKDMPMEVPEDLPLICFSAREDPRDVLVLPEGVKYPDPEKPVGTSSLRRILQLKRHYPDQHFASVRGNVQTRLRKLDEGKYSALVLAAAGLKRLGLEHRISRYFSTDEIIPAAGQGILAVQGRRNADYGFMDEFADRDSAYAAAAERAFVRELNGGCTSPVAAHAVISGEKISIRGLYYEEASGRTETGEIAGTVTEAAQLGRELAMRLRG